MTDVIRIDPMWPEPDLIARGAECLRRGGLVAFPTETVYGLGVHALDVAAVRRVFEAKRRPTHDPLIVHVASLADAEALVANVSDSARMLAQRFWPGPLTLVMRRLPHVPDEVTAGLDTVAVRVPAHPIARALIDRAAIPIAAPSANLFSRPSPTSAAHVLQDLSGRIDMVIDGGSATVGVESTVLDLSGVVPTVLRPGAIALETLRELVPGVRMQTPHATDEGATMRSPGLLSKHYSPRALLTLYEGDPHQVLGRLMWDARTLLSAGSSVGIAVTDEDEAHLATLAGLEGPHLKASLRTVRLGSRHNLGAVAARLYAALRELDATGVDVILVRNIPVEAGLGMTIQDRLRRAAAGRIVRC